MIALQIVCEHIPLAHCTGLVGPIARAVSNNSNIIIFSILWVYILSICTITLGHKRKMEKVI